MGEYRNHHYVPQWYQRRFLKPAPTGSKLHYLDLRPRFFVDPKGVCRSDRRITFRAPKKCFVLPDLYTVNMANIDSVAVEKVFFGDIDRQGQKATALLENYEHFSAALELEDLLRFMSAQKLRTPKGLRWLAAQVGVRPKNELIAFMLNLHDLHAAIWCECVWQVADASRCKTKFIISDHPVTVYNRDCPPSSPRAREWRDPDIRNHGTHTIFPLSSDKALILTNLSWVRNPYQSALGTRPNPRYYRGAIFDLREIQLGRYLTDEEVAAINYIIKMRAFRYVAAAKEEWLYPEELLRGKAWRTFSDEYLFMPDPRSLQFKGRLMAGGGRGGYRAWDEYGFEPHEAGFDDAERSAREWETFYRFRGEFARLFGPARRGRAVEGIHVSPETDADEAHEANLKYEQHFGDS